MTFIGARTMSAIAKREFWLHAARAILALAAALAPGMVAAQDARWFVTLGAASIMYQNEATLNVPPGNPIPGAAIDIPRSVDAIIEIGYRVTPGVSLRTAIGVPPTMQVQGSGSLAPLGTLGRLKVAPILGTATYGVEVGPLKPYVGAGLAYIRVLKASDGAITNLAAQSRFGGVLQGGVEIPLDDAWSANFDMRKVFWRTTATGNVIALGGAPVQAELTPSPLLLMLGISRRF